MPKVSVIIPTYNRAGYLCQAIDSVLSQTFRDFELIVVDDGSVDDTKKLLERYGDKIKFFYQENKGVGAARNLGIVKARGEYLAFLDSDDYWFENKLQYEMDIIKQSKACFVHCSAFVELNAGQTKLIKPTLPARKFEDLLRSNGIVTSSVILHKNCIEKVGLFDESLKIAEDYEFWLRILYLGNIALYLDKTLLIYRVHDKNISKNIEETKKYEIMICRKMLETNMYFRPLVKNKLSVEYYLFSKLCYEKKQYQLALRNLKNSILINPLVGLRFINSQDNVSVKIQKIIKPFLFFTFLCIKWVSDFKNKIAYQKSA